MVWQAQEGWKQPHKGQKRKKKKLNLKAKRKRERGKVWRQAVGLGWVRLGGLRGWQGSREAGERGAAAARG